MLTKSSCSVSICQRHIVDLDIYMTESYKENIMGTFQRGRHAQAFILICLTDGPAYGLELQERITNLIPGNEIDRAFLYRSLSKLESEGYLSVSVDASSKGPVRKYYSLTDSGYNLLDEFEVDIRERVENLNSFISKYEKLQRKKVN